MIERTYVIRVRLSKDEFHVISQKAKEDSNSRCKNGEKNLSKYIRNCILKESGQRKNNLERELKNIDYQVRKIGVNINQATKKINAGYGEWEAEDEIAKGLEQLNELFQSFTERLKEIDEEIPDNGDYKNDEY